MPRALALLALLCGLAAAALYLVAQTPVTQGDVSSWIAPHRYAWYALPLTVLGFIVLGALPVVLLIAATGIAFGPVLGPLYAMAGCLASASVAFAIGRWLGHGRIERWGGPRIVRRSHRCCRRHVCSWCL